MRMTYLGRRALGWAVAAGLCLLAAVPVAAQTTSASVAGQVKDAQGGVLPAATVTLTSKTQANTLTATTDAEGRFVFPIVRPDELRAPRQHAGLQDAGADHRAGQRERPVLRRHPHAWRSARSPRK